MQIDHLDHLALAVHDIQESCSKSQIHSDCFV